MIVFFANIVGDVFFGIVGTHLLPVDVFFEDVTENIGIDFAVVSPWSVIKAPLVAVKEIEEPLKRSIGNLNCSVVKSALSGVSGRYHRSNKGFYQANSLSLRTDRLQVSQILGRREDKGMLYSIDRSPLSDDATGLFGGSLGRHSGSFSSG